VRVSEVLDLTENEKQDWDRHEWAGEEHPAGEKHAPRWGDEEWAGETPGVTESELPEGEAGPTGGGHNPGEQHWVPDKE
jgi:hypothetical protein